MTDKNFKRIIKCIIAILAIWTITVMCYKIKEITNNETIKENQR
ncbi:hypothetical protein LCGC14_1726000 [marine sediment metagenome]|uniref:Uncharacterized protein n=1 Tax=marine sediment metagenome TaxID=412755 RepID=A0A0F9HYP3_9ZZZZ